MFRERKTRARGSNDRWRRKADGSHSGRKRRKENATHTVAGGKLCRGTKTKSIGVRGPRKRK